MLFRKIIVLDFARISARLQLGKKYQLPSSHVMQLYRAIHDKSITKVGRTQLAVLQEQVAALLDLYRTLKINSMTQRDPVAVDHVERIIKIVHSLSQSSELSAALDDSSALGCAERTCLRDRIGKLGQYYKASTELVLAARRKKCQMFQRIRVENFQIHVPGDVRIPSNPDSATPLIRTLRESNHNSKLLRQFKGSESKASAALLQRLDGTRSGIKVHAEIKLLFYYESHPNSVRPRVICANKSACYLCDLFLKVHGHFQVPRTFGKLNERWILPDWLDTIPPERFPVLKNAVEQFSGILDAQIQRLPQGIRRHADPMESAIGISALWSMSSLENPHKGHPIVSTVGTLSTRGKVKVSLFPSIRRAL